MNARPKTTKPYYKEFLESWNLEQCSKCEQILDLSDFYHKGDNRYSSHCKHCTIETIRINRILNIDKYRLQDRAKAKKRAKEKSQASKTWRVKLRYEVLSHYSNGEMCCQCCRDNTYRFLVIDHINDGGCKHRKALKTNGNVQDMYSWLKQNKFPDGFRVLCDPCNSSRGRYGYCPHEKFNVFTSFR